MSAKVRISPGMMSASLTLRTDSALRLCTEVDADEQGPFIARSWPTLSAGEEMLWAILAWLNGDGVPPSDHDLRGGLDSRNREAALAAIEAGTRWTA